MLYWYQEYYRRASFGGARFLSGVNMIEILRGANRCDACVYATVVTHRAEDVPKRAYCPFAGCIYEERETDEDKADQVQERRRTD